LFTETNSAKSVYNQEVAYHSIQDTKFASFNFNYNNIFYGKIDKNKICIVPKLNFIAQLDDTPTSHYLLSFVKDAYQDFRKEWERLIKKNNLNPENVYDVAPRTSYQHYEVLYSEYMQDHYNNFFEYVKSEKIESTIVDFASFLTVFSKYVSIIAADRPIALSSFILSKYCSNHVSGLCVSFLDTDSNLYQEKVDNFLLNKNFNVYNELAILHGFIIDTNCPWKLVANLESEIMKKRIESVHETKNVYSTFFDRIDYKDLEYLKKYMLEFYNQFVTKKPVTKKIENIFCNNKNKIIKKTINRILISEEEKINQIEIDLNLN